MYLLNLSVAGFSEFAVGVVKNNSSTFSGVLGVPAHKMIHSLGVDRDDGVVLVLQQQTIAGCAPVQTVVFQSKVVGNPRSADAEHVCETNIVCVPAKKKVG